MKDYEPIPAHRTSIYRAFDLAWSAMKRKEWDCIYVLVDVHGVIMEPDYTKPSEKVYYDSIGPLRRMTNDSRFKLIMWTCSREEDIEKYRGLFRQLGCEFDYVNRNPEVEHKEALGDYTQKLYANIILDDKAGFNAEGILNDWTVIETWLDDLDTDERGHN